MNIAQRTALVLLLTCLTGTACTGRGLSIMSQTEQPTSSPTPTPVNAKIFADTVSLQTTNTALLQPLADLWPANVYVSDMAFLPGTDKLLLGTGDSYQQASSAPYTSAPDTFLGVNDHTKVVLWDPLTNTGQDAFTAGNDQNLLFRSLSVSPDGTHVAFVGSDRVILATATGSAVSNDLTFTTQSLSAGKIAQPNPDAGAAFSADGELLAVVDNLGDVQVWDVASGQVLGTFISETTDDPQWGSLPECLTMARGLVFTADGKLVLSSCNYDLKINDLSTNQRTAVNTLPVGDIMNVFAFAPDGESMLVGGSDGVIDVLDYPSAQLRLELNLHSRKISSVAFSPDGNLAASASVDGSVDLWDAHTWKRLATLETEADLLAFSPDGRFLVTAAYAGGARLWGVLSSSSATTMNGVKVILSEGPITLSAWKDQVPHAWLAPAGSLPRYEIHIISSQLSVQNCSYNGNNGSSAMLNRARIDVVVEVVDMQSGASVAQTTFKGGVPDPCPATYSFGQNQYAADQYGQEPDPAQFLPWLSKVMAALGYQK